MTSNPLASDLADHMRRRLAEFEHSGCQLSPDAVRQLVTNLATIREVARDQEQLLALRQSRPRLTVISGGSGDAA